LFGVGGAAHGPEAAAYTACHYGAVVVVHKVFRVSAVVMRSGAGLSPRVCR
jgi:hypothetical protein